jgi:hypothetical protein
MDEISSPSATNRWLLKIEPGIYDVGATSLQMRSWVDIEGSGIGMTTIRGGNVTDYNATIHGASNAELRLLTVEASGNGTSIAMANYSGASPRLYRVKFSSTGGGGVWGIRNSDSVPQIEDCEITVFRNDSFSLPAGRSSILHTKIAVSGASNNYGLYLSHGQFVSAIRDSQLDVSGGVTAYGIFAGVDGPGSWLGQEYLQIRNTEINSGGGSSASYGINIQAPAWISFEINGSKVWGHVSPTTYGIVQGGQGAVGIQGSSVTGFTKTLQAAGNVSIASTLLQGGPATAQGWIGCMGVWDENAIFYAQGSCP